MSAREVLDRAHSLGLTVMMCIEIGRERLKFNYDDSKAVARQLEYARREVLKYKDHPALLAWMIGNEPNLRYKNPKVFDAIARQSVENAVMRASPLPYHGFEKVFAREINFHFTVTE